MRVASRIIGAVLVLCGLGLLTILGYELVKEGRSSDFGAWMLLGVGLVLILVGWYYLRLDLDTLDQAQPPSRFTSFSVVHRRELRVLAQTGAVLSLIHFGAACLGTDWPGRWFLWPLGIGAVVLQSIARKVADPTASENLGWARVPKRIRAVLEPTRMTGDAAMLVMLVLICGNQWFSQPFAGSEMYHRGLRVTASGYIVLLYVLEALFFRYGELRPQ